jgi:predicted esterase YcpF (UPF0227 family)
MILYFHGFASSGNSAKSQALAQAFGSHQVVAPDFPYDCAAIEDMVEREIFKAVQNLAEPIVFVGTSLGGFYANYFAAKYDSPAVLVNPSIRADLTLQQKIGKHVNYATNEEFEVTEKYVADLSDWFSYTKENYNGRRISLFLAENDEVINAFDTGRQMPHVFKRFVYKDGGHRFEKHWGTVINHIKKLRSKFYEQPIKI